MSLSDGSRSLNHLFLERVEQTPGATAYLEPHLGGWRPRSWGWVHEQVRLLSAGLRTLGVAGGAVCAETSVRWLLADFSILLTGLPTTTIYPSSTAETVRYILEDAGAGVVFITSDQLPKLLATWPDTLAHVVLMDGESADPRVYSWRALLERGRIWLQRHGTEWWREQALSVGPEDLATLIYTSGTTGRPKGVRLVHDNWLAQAVGADDLMGRFAGGGDTLYLWLPLAHAYGKVLQLAGVVTGATTVVDGDHRRIPEVLKQTSPAWVPAVPRVFEKMRARMHQQAAARGPRAERILGWALDVAVRVGRGETGRRLQLQHRLADRLIFRRIREAMGGRVRAFLCGSAPLAEDLEHLFRGLGMPILQGYGLTECAAVATVNLPDAWTFGSAGRASEGMQLRTKDGEVQMRGRAVMRGYHNLPDATAAAFDGDWFRTGDLGTYEAGELRITGRIKEILITAGGKNIAPAPIEAAVKARCALLQEVVLVGDARPTCMALITLDPDTDARHDDPEVLAQVRTAVEAANASLARHETIKDFALLPTAFSIESGELTPSQKVRRSVVVERHAAEIHRLYAETTLTPPSG